MRTIHLQLKGTQLKWTQAPSCIALRMREIDLLVDLVEKYRTPAVTAMGNVIRQSWNNHSC